MTIAAVIPCYNGARFVERCLDSVLSQTLPVDEMIVVDDGSSDDSAAVIAGWARRNGYGKLRVIKQENAGVSAARNTGWQAATSQWIAFLDIDDIWYEKHNDALAGSASTAASCVLAFCDADRWDQRNATSRQLPTVFETAQLPQARGDEQVSTCWRGGDIHTRLIRGSFIPMCCSLVSKSALEAVGGFDTGLAYGEDRELWLRLFRLGPAVCSSSLGGAVFYHGANATRHENRLTERLGKIDLCAKLLAHPEDYGFGQQNICLIKEQRLQTLNEIRYLASCSGVRAMGQYRKFLESEGMRYSSKDWLRAIAPLRHKGP